jgi:hypothetical protein
VSRQVALLAAVGTIAAACAESPGYRPEVEGGAAERGAAAIERYQCGACHRIPGIGGARGSVGPDLDGFQRRAYIAGRLPNSPEFLLPWLGDAPALSPSTAMPDVGVTPADARDIAAYLYSLE